MKLNPSEDQLELRSAVKRFIDGLTPLTAVRAVMESEQGYDAQVWNRLCNELAIPALAVSEAGGGAGFGVSELAVAMQECGAGLVPGPLLGSGVIAAQVLDAIGDTTLLPKVVEGNTIAALINDPAVTVTDGVVAGSAFGVLDAMTADQFVVVSGDSVYSVDAVADKVSRSALETMDLTRRQGVVEFTGAAAVSLGSSENVGIGLDRATVALAAEQLGAMTRSFELVVEFVKVREQFGRRIGSFQAIKHGLAEVYASLELATGAVAYAAWVADNEPENLPVAASMAKAYVGPQGFEATSQSIQYHGGIGFTWEHDAHLFYKRAKTNETLLGSTEEHLDRIAAHILDNEEAEVA